MTVLRQRMIRDMHLAGFTDGTQRAYLNGVRQLAKRYMIAPDMLTEKQVEDYVFYLREEKKVAKGTFQEYFRAIRFLYVNTLNCDWALFTKKSSPAASEASAPRPQQRRLPRADRRGAPSGLSRLPGHDVRVRTADE
jgi:hypothetical protein